MRLSAALQRMSRLPPPVQAMHPDGPLAAARAGAIMQAVMPALQAEAEALAGDLETLDTARRLHRTGLANLATGLAELEDARDALQTGLAAAGTAPFDAAPETLSRDSATLSALAEALDTGGSGDAGEPGIGRLAWPLEGEVMRGFREPDSAGVRRPGMLLAAAPLSLVTAPSDAIVRYAGPFLDYGYVAVLETDDDALLVLAGLAQIVVRGGEVVARGDLLGLLGGRALNVEEYVMLPVVETVAGARETLYVEIRHGDGPVDPMPWFETENG